MHFIRDRSVVRNPYLVMRHPVVVEIAGGREPFPADAALMGLLAAVDPPEIIPPILSRLSSHENLFLW